ncbi:VOC family protein [Agathobacter rectalis]|uniref:VOC family protein n=1 Tax=Agathobacter rectalis TaxID=39491 RepID=UPI0026B2D3C0|nr:VOC family protein [Agathobacter rectalis]
MSLIKGIHHVSMKCSSTEEYEKTIDFYKNILGIPVAREWQAGIMLDTGNGIVEIFNDGDDAPGKGVIRHFAFATDDVDACVESVKAAGYEVFIEPKGYKNRINTGISGAHSILQRTAWRGNRAV